MKRSDLPSLDDLRAFETVARHGSMRGAADELALTHGAVSRRVAKLAKDLKIPLVIPNGRGIALTPEGVKLAQSAQQAIGIISATLTSLRETTGNVPIVLSCERSVAMRWLIPRLSQFQDRHPDIPVSLSVGGGALNFVKDGISLAIRRIDFPIEPEWDLSTLFTEEMGPVMKPSMEADFQEGRYIALGTKTRPNAWSKWLAEHPKGPSPKETRLFDHHFLAAEAAASGLGVAMCPKVVALDDLSTGRLLAPAGFVPDGSAYGLIYPKAPELSEQMSILANWILETSRKLARQY